jgi:hypothetical protein
VYILFGNLFLCLEISVTSLVLVQFTWALSPCKPSVCLFSWRYDPLWLYFHSPVAGFSLLVFEVSKSHATTRHIRQDSSGRVINPSQRPLPDNTQHSQQTNIHAPGGIRTNNLSRRAAEDLRLRPRGHWDRRKPSVNASNSKVVIVFLRCDIRVVY